MSETFRVWDVEKESLRLRSILNFAPLPHPLYSFRTLRATDSRM
jgi:hypothetical protein